MQIDHAELKTFKESNLPLFLELHYGLHPIHKTNGSFLMLCPFHDDKTPSFSLSQKNNVYLWRCFACNIGGTIVDFVMKKENLTLLQAYQFLREKLKTSSNGIHKANPLELLKNVTDFYQKTLWEDKRGLDYLRGRGIKSEETLRSFKTGFVNGLMRKTFSYSNPLLKDLKDLGLLNQEGNEVFYNSIVIPLSDPDGNVVSLYGRNISHKRHLYLKGPHQGLVNHQGSFNTEKVIFTEAVLDALSLYELGIRNVIPLYGTGGFTEDHKELLKKQRTKEVEICFDTDDAGTSGAKDLSEKLAALGIQASRVKLPEGIKDANDFLLAGKTKEDFELLERIPFEIPKNLFSAENLYQVTREKGTLHFKIAERAYRVLLPEFDSISNLRVNLKLTIGENTHIDLVDLYSDRQRKAYTQRIHKKFSLEESQIEEDLTRILEELEKGRQDSLQNDEAKPYSMTPEEKEEALKALKSLTLTQDILNDLERIGCVGENTPKLLGLLVCISRKLENPLSLILISQSSAGKSNLADSIQSITPKEDCIHLSRITPQALFYMERDALKGKFLTIEEKEGSTDADYSLRALQSKGVLRLAAPIKDPKTGRMKTETFEVEGPPSTIETTTNQSVHPENASRCFMGYMDESEFQTKRIHDYQRKQKTLDRITEKKIIDALKIKHQNMQRLLRPLAVVIPYVHHIKFPTKWMRARRDNQRFLNLIQVTTFLHQYQRNLKKTPEGLEYIESSLEDYRVAYTLSKEVLHDSFQEPKKLEKDFLEKLCELAKEEKRTRFTCRKAREYTNLPDYLVRRHLDNLVKMEYLFLVEGKNGTKFEYEINPTPIQEKEIIEGLTTPEELEKILKKRESV